MIITSVSGVCAIGEEGGTGRIKQLFWQDELDRYELEI